MSRCDKNVSLEHRVFGGNVCILIRRPHVGPCIFDENVGVLCILLPQDVLLVLVHGRGYDIEYLF